jgi:hypothetical protein
VKDILALLHENIIVASRQNGGEPMEPIEQKTLETFVSGKFDWQSLSPSKQKAMAIELLKARFLLQQQYKFMEGMLDGSDDQGDVDNAVR